MIKPGDLVRLQAASGAIIWHTYKTRGEAWNVGHVKFKDVLLVIACKDTQCMVLTPSMRYGWLDYRLLTADVERTPGP